MARLLYITSCLGAESAQRIDILCDHGSVSLILVTTHIKIDLNLLEWPGENVSTKSWKTGYICRGKKRDLSDLKHRGSCILATR